MMPATLSRRGTLVLAAATALFLCLFAFQAYAVTDLQRPNVVFVAPSSSTLSGTVTITLHASDASGIDRMGANFHDASRDYIKNCGLVKNLPGPAENTFSCTFDTKKLPDGVYEIRGGAFDEANNNRTIWEWVTIDNVPDSEVVPE